jgi:hypothetical protein
MHQAKLIFHFFNDKWHFPSWLTNIFLNVDKYYIR